MKLGTTTGSPAASGPWTGLVKLLSALLALLFFLSMLLAAWVPESVKMYFYGIFREIARVQMLLRTHGWQQLQDEHFIIRYRGDEEEARLVGETARLFYRQICRDFAYVPQLHRMPRVPIVVYGSREELNASFGWPASENAMGVYWGGVIRVLAPRVWVEDGDAEAVRRTFQQAGPIAHELTHLVLDYAARGNYPRWFTEGVAQYEEFKLTGFTLERQAGIYHQRLYPLDIMNRGFDALPDQALAYWQSLSLVQYIVAVYGEEGLHNIIKNLSRHTGFNEALVQSLGLDEKRLEKEWHDWLTGESRRYPSMKREETI